MESTSDYVSVDTYEDLIVTPAFSFVQGVTVSQELYDAVLGGFSYFTIVAGVPGVVANILIIITYVKMGITNSINVSYTAMAISDLGCVLTTIWVEILLIPRFQTLEFLPFIPAEILSATAAYPNMAFAKATAWITAYISLERCLCVAFPHKVKLLFTKRLTTIVLIVISVFNIIPAVLTAFWNRLGWKITSTNRTVLGSTRLYTPSAMKALEIQNYLYGFAYQWIPIIITLICAIFLAIYLKAGSEWRNKNFQSSKNDKESNAQSSREERIIKTVLSIAVLSIVLSTPVSVNFILSAVAPSLTPFLFERSVGTMLACFATAMTMLNSCFNIVIYYKLGTKFRLTLRQLLSLADDTSKPNKK